LRADPTRIHSDLSNPLAIPTAKSPQEAAGLLARLVADSMHIYLDYLPSPVSEGWRDVFGNLLGHLQITDAYLLRVAAANNAVLVTFDRRLENLAGGKLRVTVLG
jgi:predicted nucleic acid-binding protein